jgi:hypothetical protein
VAHRAAADVRLGELLHGDRREHARGHVGALERVLQGERVHHRRQHAHVVGAGAIHAARRAGHAAEDVAAADDQRDLDAERAYFGDLGGDALEDGGIDAEAGVAHEGFARELE